ncbi:hypothetical protein ANO11243_010030 [Dothideomycetidae sp. 11243]|nr:hypothetical protein ANO11243_010030 [fungal sp. No.11243]
MPRQTWIVPILEALTSTCNMKSTMLLTFAAALVSGGWAEEVADMEELVKRDSSCTHTTVNMKRAPQTHWNTITATRTNWIYQTSTPTVYYTPTVTTTSYWDYATLVYGAVATVTTGTTTVTVTESGAITAFSTTTDIVNATTTVMASSSASGSASAAAGASGSASQTASSTVASIGGTVSSASSSPSASVHARSADDGIAGAVMKHLFKRMVVDTVCTSTLYNTVWPTSTVVAAPYTSTVAPYTVSVNTYGVSTLTHTTEVEAKVTQVQSAITTISAEVTVWHTSFATVTAPWSSGAAVTSSVPSPAPTKGPVVTTICQRWRWGNICHTSTISS